MNLDDRTIQTHRFDLDADELLALQLRKQAIEHTGFGPTVHARVDGVPVPKAFGQRAPFAAILGHIEYGVDHVEILMCDVAVLSGQVLRDASELFSIDFHRTSVSNMCA